MPSARPSEMRSSERRGRSEMRSSERRCAKPSLTAACEAAVPLGAGARECEYDQTSSNNVPARPFAIIPALSQSRMKELVERRMHRRRKPITTRREKPTSKKSGHCDVRTASGGRERREDGGGKGGCCCAVRRGEERDQPEEAAESTFAPPTDPSDKGPPSDASPGEVAGKVLAREPEEADDVGGPAVARSMAGWPLV